MFSFVDLRLLLLLAATALLTHGQEEGQEEDSKSQTLGESKATWCRTLCGVSGVRDLNGDSGCSRDSGMEGRALPRRPGRGGSPP